MKKFLLAALALFGAASISFAQQEPTTTWPYLYQEFTAGTLHYTGGAEKEGIFNVHLLYGRLHFVDGEYIKEITSSEVYSVKIGSDIYVNVNGKMMQVVARNDNGFVARDREIDMVKLNSTGGAYGSSSSSVSTQAYSSLEAFGSSTVNINHMEMRSNKENGQTLPLVVKDYMVIDGECIYATRKDFSSKVGSSAASAFLKEHKIKWKDPQSVLEAVDFIATSK